MELDIRPEPSDPVRRAIAKALETVETREPESAWWRAGSLNYR